MRRGHADHRVEREVADEYVQRRQAAQHAHPARLHADFLRRLAERGCRDGFRRLDLAAGQRNLPAVLRQRAGAHRQQEMRHAVAGVEQNETGGRPRAIRYLIRAPAFPRTGREAEVGVTAGQRRLERRSNPRFDLIE